MFMSNIVIGKGIELTGVESKISAEAIKLKSPDLSKYNSENVVNPSVTDILGEYP